MLSFFTTATADDCPVTFFVDGGPTATDPNAGFAGAVLGCDPEAPGLGSLTPAQAFELRDLCPMFDRSELWAVMLAIREGLSRGALCTRAHELLSGAP